LRRNQHYVPPSGLQSIHAACRRTLVVLHECTLRYAGRSGLPLTINQE